LGYERIHTWVSISVDFDSIRVGLRLHLISTLAILLSTPVGPGLLTFGVGGCPRWTFQKEQPTHRVNQTQTLHVGVAEPTEKTSRLIADVQLDNGFPLEPGVAGFDRVLTGVAAPKTAI